MLTSLKRKSFYLLVGTSQETLLNAYTNVSEFLFASNFCTSLDDKPHCQINEFKRNLFETLQYLDFGMFFSSLLACYYRNPLHNMHTSMILKAIGLIVLSICLGMTKSTHIKTLIRLFKLCGFFFGLASTLDATAITPLIKNPHDAKYADYGCLLFNMAFCFILLSLFFSVNTDMASSEFQFSKLMQTVVKLFGVSEFFVANFIFIFATFQTFIASYIFVSYSDYGVVQMKEINVEYEELVDTEDEERNQLSPIDETVIVNSKKTMLSLVLSVKWYLLMIFLLNTTNFIIYPGIYPLLSAIPLSLNSISGYFTRFVFIMFDINSKLRNKLNKYFLLFFYLLYFFGSIYAIRLCRKFKEFKILFDSISTALRISLHSLCFDYLVGQVNANIPERYSIKFNRLINILLFSSVLVGNHIFSKSKVLFKDL